MIQENNQKKNVIEVLTQWSSPIATIGVIVAAVMWAHSLYRDTQQLRVDFATFMATTNQRLSSIESEQSSQGRGIANLSGKLDLLLDRYPPSKN